MTCVMIEKITSAIGAVLPEQLTEDVRLAVRRAVQAALADADVVSREDFEIQQAVLQKTRQKLEKLEEQIADLESSIST